MENPEILIYTDGSSRGNPGPGGYGIIIQQFSDKRSKEFSKGFRKTTNNRMELLAVIEALKKLTVKNLKVHIYTDSKYVVDAVEKKWVFKWKKTKLHPQDLPILQTETLISSVVDGQNKDCVISLTLLTL